jgi:hypothetical protein
MVMRNRSMRLEPDSLDYITSAASHPPTNNPSLYHGWHSLMPPQHNRDELEPSRLRRQRPVLECNEGFIVVSST